MAVSSVGIIAYSQVNPFIFSIPYSIFTVSLSDKPLFKVHTVSMDGRPLELEGGLVLNPEGGLALLEHMDIIIVPGWHDREEPPSPELTEALVRAHERGAWVVGLCYGAYALAYAGLLDNKRASTHWMAEGDFSQRFPAVQLDTNSLYAENERVVTSAGIGAGLDCCLFLVREIYGVRIANKVARVMVLPPHREGGQAQFIEQNTTVSSKDTRIYETIRYLLEHLEEPQSLDALANRAAMSRRTFTRHFLQATGTTVGKWLTIQRLQRSCELLESTTLSIEEIAERAGFQTSVSFRLQFRKQYKVSPRVWRNNFAPDCL